MNTPKTSGSSAQVERFKQAARDASTDESEEAFDRQLKRLAKPKPKKEKPGK